jgi:hypothetical protein
MLHVSLDQSNISACPAGSQANRKESTYEKRVRKRTVALGESLESTCR